MLREQKLAVVGLTLLLVIPISFVFLIVLYEPTENYLVKKLKYFRNILKN